MDEVSKLNLLCSQYHIEIISLDITLSRFHNLFCRNTTEVVPCRLRVAFDKLQLVCVSLIAQLPTDQGSMGLPELLSIRNAFTEASKELLTWLGEDLIMFRFRRISSCNMVCEINLEHVFKLAKDPLFSHRDEV